MVNNQIEFNNIFTKESKQIEVTYENYEEQSLIIKDYLELEKLELREIGSIEQVTLQNLPNLQEVTIWDCGVKDLIIENCSQIKKLIVRTNSLTTLDFLTSLDNLVELDLYGNTELVELLKPYNGDWKIWKEIQKLSKQDSQMLATQLWNLQQKVKSLKENELVTDNNPTDFEKKYQELKKFLHSLTSEEKLKSKEIVVLKTKDLTNTLSGKISDQERNLLELQETNEELREKIKVYEADRDRILKKEEELLRLTRNIITNKPEIIDDLEELLEAQQENNQKWLVRIKKRLAKQITEKEVNDLCQLQRKITQLKSNINQQVQQINQIINNYYGNSRVYHNSKHNEFNNNRFDQAYFEVVQQEIPLKTK